MINLTTVQYFTDFCLVGIPLNKLKDLQVFIKLSGFVQVMENLESHEVKNFIFQALKVKEFNCRLWKVVEN